MNRKKKSTVVQAPKHRKPPFLPARNSHLKRSTNVKKIIEKSNNSSDAINTINNEDASPAIGLIKTSSFTLPKAPALPILNKIPSLELNESNLVVETVQAEEINCPTVSQRYLDRIREDESTKKNQRQEEYRKQLQEQVQEKERLNPEQKKLYKTAKVDPCWLKDMEKLINNQAVSKQENRDNNSSSITGSRRMFVHNRIDVILLLIVVPN